MKGKLKASHQKEPLISLTQLLAIASLYHTTLKISTAQLVIRNQ